MMPTVTIVIPTYNRCDLLHGAIESALNQTYPASNVLVFDNASTDDTPSIIARYMGNPRFVGVHAPQNLNISSSWGTALSHATGDYITFLGDDEILRPDYARVMMKAMEQPGVATVFANYDLSADQKLPPGLPETCPAGLWSGERLIKAAVTAEWHIGPTLYRKSDLLRLWPQLSDDGNVFDIGLHLRLALEGAVAAYVPDRLYIWTQHPGQISYKRRETMFEDKERTLRTILTGPMPASYRRIIVKELSDWYVVWGRDRLKNGQRAAAISKIVAGIQAAPGSSWAWRQLARSLIKRQTEGRPR